MKASQSIATILCNENEVCGPIKGNVGDVLRDKCEEFTCTSQKQETEWISSGKVHECLEEKHGNGGRKGCKKPLV